MTALSRRGRCADQSSVNCTGIRRAKVARPSASGIAGRGVPGSTRVCDTDGRSASAGARPGVWGVQLGAMSDADRARAQADALTDRHGDLLAGGTVTVASAGSAGATLYRLRVFGFDDEAAARAACAG